MKDIAGQKFNRLTAIKYVGRTSSNHALWLFRCDCGTEKVIEESSVTKKNSTTKSCGCLNNEVRKSGNNGRKHGMAGTRINRIWKAMRNRCNNPSDKYYHCYGGKGIKVCSEWDNKDGFAPFYEWAMANGYAENLTIDRIDSDKGYSPDNCRWATYTEQARNKKNFPKIEYNGESHTIREWADIIGISKSTLIQRLNRQHWSVEDALTRPLRK